MSVTCFSIQLSAGSQGPRSHDTVYEKNHFRFFLIKFKSPFLSKQLLKDVLNSIRGKL